MKPILEELYYGHIRPFKRIIHQDPDHPLNRKISDLKLIAREASGRRCSNVARACGLVLRLRRAGIRSFLQIRFQDRRSDHDGGAGRQRRTD
jgi:hypothetical protein